MYNRGKLCHNWFSAPLERFLILGCERWCRFVAKHPWHFIILPILSTAIFSSGILFKLRVVRGVNFLYSALDAPWKEEYQTFMDNWANQDNRFYPGRDALLRPGLFIIATAHDNGSVLRPSHALQLTQLIDWVQSVPVKLDDHVFTFADVCLQMPGGGHCFGNENARIVAEMFTHAGDKEPNPFNVTYPQFRFPQLPPAAAASESIDLSTTLGGAKLFSDKKRLKSARAWMIIFQLRRHPVETIGRMSSHFEQSLAELIRQGHAPTPLLQLSHYHSGTFDRELAENAIQLMPKFAATFGLLVLFSVLCTFDWIWVPIRGGKLDEKTNANWINLPAIDWVHSKPLLGICGVLSTLMAIASATGILLWADVTFVDICAVMPFLSLTIGIDDTFLMLAAWRSTSPLIPAQMRLEQAMRHAAVSIFITSLTDALAFLIGSIAPLPAVIYFCYYSALAILFIFIHFMTIFMAVLALQGCWEAQGKHCLFGCQSQNADEYVDVSACCAIPTALLNSGRDCTTKLSPLDFGLSVTYSHWSQRILARPYTMIITHWAVQFVALISLVSYLIMAQNGIQHLTVGFKLIDIISYDIRARQFLLFRNDFFAKDVQRLELAVMRAPNLGNPLERDKFLEALDELESVSNCTQKGGIQFWWHEWKREAAAKGHGEEFMRMDLDEEAFSKMIRPFLNANPRLEYDVLPTPDHLKIEAFRLSLQMVHFQSDQHLSKCAREMRAICHRHYAKFGLISYSPLWNLADQFEIIWPQTMQDLYISVGVMTLVALLAIPRAFCAPVIALNIMSIGFGAIGFMPYWDVNLDATSMITIAMSVGFSVDFAAHITYSYILVAQGHKSAKGKSKATPLECVEGALGAVGWPISQASFSVMLGICPLATVNTHIISTCFKTVFLVILFGWLHALLYLPLALMNAHRLYNWCSIRKWGKWNAFFEINK